MKIRLSMEEFENLYLREFKTTEEIGNICGFSKFIANEHRKYYKIPSMKTTGKYRMAKYSPLTPQLKSVILGGLLGDSSLEKTPDVPSRDYMISFSHSLKQKSYAEWKKQLFGDLMPAKLQNITVHANGIAHPAVRSRSLSRPDFTQMRKIWYLNDIKTISYDLVKDLNPLALAIWYMDDGTKVFENTRCSLATCSFTGPELDILQKILFNNFGLQSSICYKYSKEEEKSYPNIYFDIYNGAKLMSIISDFVNQIPEMTYKIN